MKTSVEKKVPVFTYAEKTPVFTSTEEKVAYIISIILWFIAIVIPVYLLLI